MMRPYQKHQNAERNDGSRRLSLDLLQTASPCYDSVEILSRLSDSSSGLLRSLQILPALDSTNAELLRRPASAMHGVALLAEEQDSGRGRGANSWYSPAGVGIYFSCGWVSAVSPGADISPCLAAQVVEMLAGAGLTTARVRQPNDIYVADAKLGGILIESRGDGVHSRSVVGIGINTEPHPGRDSVGCPVTDLRTEGITADPNMVVAGLINTVLPFMAERLPAAL